MNEPGMADSTARDWFREWFGDEYLAIYPHRDEQEARQAVRLYLSASAPPPGPILDLACGAGRHLRELLSAGLHAVGLDLSMTMLRKSRESSPRGALIRGDMRRLPFRAGGFSGLTSFFTSFGYFASPAQDRQAAGEMRRVLTPGGSFMLDFLNAERVRRDLVPAESGRIRGYDLAVERRIEDDTVIKSIRLRPDGGGDSQVFEERVRLYEPEALEALLRDAGLDSRMRFGDYTGGRFDSDSVRMILAGVAA